MEEFHLYKDIKARTGGEIFLGVVEAQLWTAINSCRMLWQKVQKLSS